MLSDSIGPSGVKGFPVQGTRNVETLFEEPGFGLIDGLIWKQEDIDASLLVTTNPLLEKWVASHPDLPQTIPAALKSEKLYTSGLLVDLHWERYVEVPIRKPTGATFATAFLGTQSSDSGGYAPNGIAIAVVMPSRTYLFDVLIANVPQISE